MSIPTPPEVGRQPLKIWLTDRSRYSTGTGRCGRERYLKNHHGATGYGIVRKAESLPLMTGSYTHVALEQLYQHLQQTDTFPTVGVIRGAINLANQQYEQRIAARGFRGLLASERTDTIIKEQQYLITGMVWALCRNVLPWIHANYRILRTEAERIYMLDCDCGLGSAVLDATLHDAKGCHGIGLMLKQDCVGQKRVGNTLAYFEAKTTGWGGDNWAPQWETKPQLAIGSLGLYEEYGQEVSENFIIALYKGSRKTTKPTDPFEEAVTRQESPFCYGYFKPGNPPLAEDDWKPAYEWVDDVTGETKYARRPYAKQALWDMAEGDWPIWKASSAQDPSITPAELWASWLPKSVLDKQVYLIGPLNRQDAQILSLKRQIAGEEQRWQAILWKLYEAQRDHGWQWQDDEFQALLDHLVPASFECRRFGVKHECEFLRLCFKQSGWEDPALIGFVPRRPHHEPELDQSISRGLLPELAEDEEGDDE